MQIGRTLAIPEITAVIAAYEAVWNETDAANRMALLDQAWADDGLYVDPVSEGRVRDALDAIIAAFQKQAPGAHIVRTSGIDQHHHQIRFSWSMVSADGSTAIAGIDAGELDDDGRIARIAGFWAEPPARE